jgi:hypothetical protein
MVMRTGVSKVPKPVNQAAAREDLQRIFKSLAAKYGNDLQLLDKEDEWMNNSAKVCDMLLGMYQQIAALPNKRAANVVRSLVTANSTKPSPSATTDPDFGTHSQTANVFDQFDAGAAKTRFTRYTNPKYRFSAAVPSNVFVKNETPASNDRALFVSQDGRTKLLLLGKYSPPSRTLATIYSEWATEHTAADPGKIVDYKVLRDGWFVVSGQDGPRGFYVKGVLRQQTLLLMCLEYDEQDCPLTEQDIGTMARSFDGK